MAIQWDNAVCVMGCVKEQSSGLEGLFNFQVHKTEELWYITFVLVYKWINVKGCTKKKSI